MKRKIMSGIVVICMLLLTISIPVAAAGESYSDLEALIAEANEIKSEYYTTTSYSALQNGISEAEAVSKDSAAATIESAYKKLYGLMRNLIFTDGIEKTESEETTITKSGAVLISGVGNGSVSEITGSFTMRNRTALSNDKISYVRFDASSLKNKKIASAKLSMTVNKVSVPANYEGSTIDYTIGAFAFEDKTFNQKVISDLTTDDMTLFNVVYDEANAINTADFTVNTADAAAPDVTVEIDVTGYLERAKRLGDVGFALHGINSKCKAISGDVGVGNNSVCLKVTTEVFAGQATFCESVSPAQINSTTLKGNTEFVTFLNGSTSATTPQHLNSNGSSKSTFQVRARSGNNNYKRGILAFDLSGYNNLDAATVKLKLNVKTAPEQSVNLEVREYVKSASATVELLTVADLDTVIASNVDPDNTLASTSILGAAALTSTSTGELVIDISSDYVNNCLGGKLILVLTGVDQDDVSGSASEYDITFDRYGDNEPKLEISATADYPWGKETVKLVKADGSEVNSLDSLAESDIIGATIPKASLTDGKGGVKLMVAAYDNEDMLSAVKVVSEERYGDISGDNFSVYFDSALGSNIKLVKAFIWSDDLSPYFSAATTEKTVN